MLLEFVCIDKPQQTLMFIMRVTCIHTPVCKKVFSKLQ